MKPDVVAPPGFAEGIRQFNAWMFYDCHETLEDIWRETGEKGDDSTLTNFYQGIIKAAAGYHHLLRENYRGAVNLLSDTFRLLEPYRPTTLGVDVDALLNAIRETLVRVEELGDDHLREFERERIPRIAFDEAEGAQAPPSTTSGSPSTGSMSDTQPTSDFVEANGLRLHYLAWGDADAPAIVLNHATGFLARLWEPVAERLAAEGWRVLAYDARGHGDSEKPAPVGDNYDWHKTVDDLRGFLDAMGLRDVPFVGHSFGGAAGLYLAGTRSEYLSRLVAIEPIVMPGGFVPDETRRDEMAAGARKRRMSFGSAEEMLAQYRSRETFAKWQDYVLRLYVEHGTYRREDGSLELKCSGEIEGAMFSHSGSLGVWDVLPQVEAPVLVMRGETTEGFLSMVAEQVAGRVKDGRLETVTDAGHLVVMQRPEVVAERVLGFLRDA